MKTLLEKKLYIRANMQRRWETAHHSTFLPKPAEYHLIQKELSCEL